jgi:hypothetical protein
MRPWQRQGAGSDAWRVLIKSALSFAKERLSPNARIAAVCVRRSFRHRREQLLDLHAALGKVLFVQVCRTPCGPWR